VPARLQQLVCEGAKSTRTLPVRQAVKARLLLPTKRLASSLAVAVMPACCLSVVLAKALTVGVPAHTSERAPFWPHTHTHENCGQRKTNMFHPLQERLVRVLVSSGAACLWKE